MVAGIEYAERIIWCFTGVITGFTSERNVEQDLLAKSAQY
jgi:hypothetical protein